MKRVFTISIILGCLAAVGFAQTPEPEIAYVIAGAFGPAGGEGPDDPAYATYQEGYRRVMNEEWKLAYELFEELRRGYPKSRYADDAQYWAAYSLMHIDREKAIDAYRVFLKKHPRSEYVDDAIADLAEFEPEDLRAMMPPSHGGAPVAAPAFPEHEEHAMQAVLAKQERMLRRQEEEMRRFAVIAPHAVVRPRMPRGESLSTSVQVKIEALRALSHATDDAAAFEKVRVIAIDGRQPEPVREAALETVSHFRDPQALTVLVHIARSDTNQELQILAIDLIGEHRAAKNERVTTLINLYKDVPQHRQEQRRAIFYSIAGIGNDRAVDFLKTVAISDTDDDLRRDAVFYLGGIGTEHARTALYEILNAD